MQAIFQFTFGCVAGVLKLVSACSPPGHKDVCASWLTTMPYNVWS